MKLTDSATSLPIRRLTVILDHVAPGDDDAYKSEIDLYGRDLRDAFEPMGFDEIEFIMDHDELPARIRDSRPEFVLHLAEYGFKGSHSVFCCQIPALLEAEGIPFSNVGPRGMVFSADKHLINQVMKAAGVPVPQEVPLHRNDILGGNFEVPESFPFPAFLKTRLNGGSVGIAGDENIVRGSEDIARNFPTILASFTPYDIRGENMDEWLLQEFLPGPEYSVGIVGNGEALDVLTVGMLRPSEHYLSYSTSSLVGSDESELRASADRYVPANLPADEERMLVSSATAAYRKLACRDYARFDFRKDSRGVIRLIDANSLPGIYKGSAFVTMAGMRNQSFDGLMQQMLRTSLDRCFPGRDAR